MPTWEEIFSSRDQYNMQLLIEVSGGTYLTNTEIAQESFNLTEMLSDSTQLKFGGCNASQFKLRIRSSVQNMTGKTIVVKQFAYTDADMRIVILNGNPMAYNTRTEEYTELGDDYYVYGTYEVRTDKPTPDKSYRDISAFDALVKVINEDIGEWYKNFFDTYDAVTLKFFREALLSYFGIAYENFTGVNDGVQVGKTITTTTISAVSILRAICELNGCFGFITRENKFKCKVLNTETVVKTYDRYKQGQINYQDALANVITQVRIFSDISKAEATIGTAGNSYIINDNILLYGKDNRELETIASNLLPIVSGCAYRPFTCVTYGDPCVELGDFINIPTSDKLVDAFLLHRELNGTQALTDKLEAKGEEVNGSGNTGSSAVISQLNSQMSQVTEKEAITYYLFRNATEMVISDGNAPTRIARIRYITQQNTDIDTVSEFKMDVDFSTGSDRCKVYVYYYYDGDLVDYQPIETYNLDDFHTWRTGYAYVEGEANIGQHTFEVFLATEGGDVTIGIEDASVTLHGQGLVAKDEWDGYLEASDEITAHTGGSMHVIGLSDAVEITEVGLEDLSASDVVTAHTGGSMHISLTEDVMLVTQKLMYDIESADEQYQIGSSDGEWYLGTSE